VLLNKLACHCNMYRESWLIRASPLTYDVRLPETCARATCDRRDQSAHELAPLAAPSNTNAFTCVYINVIAVGSNSFFPSFLHSYLAQRYWVITSRILSSYHLHDILALREYLLTAPYTCTHLWTRDTHTARLTRSHACTAFSVTSIDRLQRSLECGRAVARQVLTRKHGIEAADQEARDSLIRLARGVTIISIGQSHPDD